MKMTFALKGEENRTRTVGEWYMNGYLSRGGESKQKHEIFCYSSVSEYLVDFLFLFYFLFESLFVS